MSMTRAEHLAWAKERALAEPDAARALALITSDCSKHPELAGHAGNQLGMMLLMGGHLSTPEQVRHHIEGYA